MPGPQIRIHVPKTNPSICSPGMLDVLILSQDVCFVLIFVMECFLSGCAEGEVPPTMQGAWEEVTEGLGVSRPELGRPEKLREMCPAPRC